MLMVRNCIMYVRILVYAYAYLCTYVRMHNYHLMLSKMESDHYHLKLVMLPKVGPGLGSVYARSQVMTGVPDYLAEAVEAITSN